ncbi:Uncharacterised protein [Vibrio cholerae]|nr:Uncharacterised protein [Vibrio cholerae]
MLTGRLRDMRTHMADFDDQCLNFFHGTVGMGSLFDGEFHILHTALNNLTG